MIHDDGSDIVFNTLMGSTWSWNLILSTSRGAATRRVTPPEMEPAMSESVK